MHWSVMQSTKPTDGPQHAADRIRHVVAGIAGMAGRRSILYTPRCSTRPPSCDVPHLAVDNEAPRLLLLDAAAARFAVAAPTSDDAVGGAAGFAARTLLAEQLLPSNGKRAATAAGAHPAGGELPAR